MYQTLCVRWIIFKHQLDLALNYDNFLINSEINDDFKFYGNNCCMDMLSICYLGHT